MRFQNVAVGFSHRENVRSFAGATNWPTNNEVSKARVRLFLVFDILVHVDANQCPRDVLMIYFSIILILTTVKPRFNEPLFNEVLDITNDILRPGQSYSKM